MSMSGPLQGPEEVPSTATGETQFRRSGSKSISSHGSMRSSSNQKTLSFFKNLIGNRSADYHRDAPQTVSGIGYRMSNNFASQRNVNVREMSTDGEQQHLQRRSCWAGLCNLFRCCAIPREARRRFFLRVVRSWMWNYTLILFTIALIFGGPIRDLWCPKKYDAFFDYFFLTIMCFFSVDLVMRVECEPNYFGCRICGRGTPAGGSDGGASCWDIFNVGSFIFYCELASTLALLHEISFINRQDFQQQQIRISLNQFGAPVSGLQDVNEASPVEYKELDLLVTIAKTARIARFIRSSTAVNISSKVNWYWILNLLTPSWWFRRCCRKPPQEKEARDLGVDPTGTGGPTALSLERASSAGRSPGGRRASWGVVSLGVMAGIHGRIDEEHRDNFFTRGLKMLGVMKRGDDEMRQHMAAVKIQRAWRKVLEQRNFDDDGYETGGDHSNPNQDSTWRLRNPPSANGGRGGGAAPSNPGVVSSLPTSGDLATRKSKESQVGSAMRELTGQRVAIGILVALIVTVLFTYTENDATRPATMIVLHTQTSHPAFAMKSLRAARASSIPDLFKYQFADNSTPVEFAPEAGDGNIGDLRDREILRVTIRDSNQSETVGYFAYKNEARHEALVELLSTIFIMLVWFFGVTGFAGPVMILVVIPIERMVSLLEMLMKDPLGYQNSARYKRFVAEENELTKNTRWTKEVLKGMETSFLMLTILRIGSLMKVGFGSAGVEIIRNNLEGRNKSMLKLSGKGSTVSCIFLFCDIRQFTDATECLQEEVFVFTNKIAAVVHSICHSYGGSANKNIGDAFLLSWRLDEKTDAGGAPFRRAGGGGLVANNNQADKALLSVVRICMALQYDEYYLETMSDAAREALLAKLSKRKGPVVQLGFGLHAGKAVQGSIGSQRKIDATYVSEAVERAEFLESSTKKYGLKMLMSDEFYRLLHTSNRRRCRKVDQIIIKNDDDDDDDDPMNGDIMELWSYDMDIEALWKSNTVSNSGVLNSGRHDSHESDAGDSHDKPKRHGVGTPSARQISLNKLHRRRSVRHKVDLPSDELSDRNMIPTQPQGGNEMEQDNPVPQKLVLPTGPALYNAKVWVDPDMRIIRKRYSDGIFSIKFNSGLQAFYAKDWETAKHCFSTVLERFEDGPSRYFMTQIEKYNGIPPRNFMGYGIE